MRSMIKNLVIVISALLCVFLFVGCDSNAVNEELGYVRFSDDADSRGLISVDNLVYPVEDCYWTYVAVKTDGLYTKGESVKATASNPNPGLSSDGYVERPVKNGPAAGLGAEIGPFSTGDWKFTLYGYANVVVDSTTGKCKFQKLIYKGTPDPEVTRVVKRSSSTDPVSEVMFVLSDVSEQEKGYLKFGSLSLTIPQGYRLSYQSGKSTSVRITVSDVTASESPVEIATAVIPVDKVYEAGDVIGLGAPSFKTTTSDVFDPGERIISVKVEYNDWFTDGEKATEKEYEATSGWATLGTTKVFPVFFKAGRTVTVSGDLNDIKCVYDENSHGVMFAEGPVAKIDSTEYQTLADAVAAYTSGKTIVLLKDIEKAGVVTPSMTVTLNPNGHYIKGLYVNGSNTVEILADGDTERSYKFGGGFIDDFSYTTDTVWLDTTGGNLTVNTTDSVYHTGKLTTLDIVKVANTTGTTTAASKSYHLGLGVGASVTTVTLQSGWLEMAENVTVATLNVHSSGTKITGKPGTVLGVYSLINGSTTTELGNNTNTSTNRYCIAKKQTAAVTGASGPFVCVTFDYSDTLLPISAKSKGYVYLVPGIKNYLVPEVNGTFFTVNTGYKGLYWCSKQYPTGVGDGTVLAPGTYTLGADSAATYYPVVSDIAAIDRYATRKAYIQTIPYAGFGNDAAYIKNFYSIGSGETGCTVEFYYQQLSCAPNSINDGYYPELFSCGNNDLYATPNNCRFLSHMSSYGGNNDIKYLSVGSMCVRVGTGWGEVHNYDVVNTNKTYFYLACQDGMTVCRLGAAKDTAAEVVTKCYFNKSISGGGSGLMASPTGTCPQYGRIGEVKIWDNAQVQTDATLACDLVPCVLKAKIPDEMWASSNYTGMNKANTVGMWDIVNNKFYTSCTAKVFTAGTSW